MAFDLKTTGVTAGKALGELVARNVHRCIVRCGALAHRTTVAARAARAGMGTRRRD